MPTKPTKAELKRSDAALKAFHSYYASTWSEQRWHNSLYPALSKPTSYAAVLNSFAGQHDLEGEQLGFIGIPCLQNSLNKFPPPASTPLLSHYNLDAASLIPVQLLDVRADHTVLDLCAAPGGKTVALAQYRPACLHSNEPNVSRNKSLAANVKAYLPADFPIKVLSVDATNKKATFPLDEYDRILVDAPCSSERHIIQAYTKRAGAGQVAEEMMNWKQSHTTTLAKTQLAVLTTALKKVKIGGKVVYATCSVSDVENDGIIDRALEGLKNEKSWRIATEHEDAELDKIAERTKYGYIVLPDRSLWGPLFFCVLTKQAHLTNAQD